MKETPADLRGAVRWLYCLTDQRRRVVKVGISTNVPKRAVMVQPHGVAFLRQWCRIECRNREQFQVVRTWAMGNITRPDAQRIEALAHVALRDVADISAGEWFKVSPRVAVRVIERACATAVRSEAA